MAHLVGAPQPTPAHDTAPPRPLGSGTGPAPRDRGSPARMTQGWEDFWVGQSCAGKGSLGTELKRVFQQWDVFLSSERSRGTRLTKPGAPAAWPAADSPTRGRRLPGPPAVGVTARRVPPLPSACREGPGLPGGGRSRRRERHRPHARARAAVREQARRASAGSKKRRHGPSPEGRGQDREQPLATPAWQKPRGHFSPCGRLVPPEGA